MKPSPTLLLLSLACLFPTLATCSSPDGRLARADSLLVSGDPYRASALVYLTLTDAIRTFEGDKDQEHLIWLYWVGRPCKCYLRDVAAAESLFEAALSLKKRIMPIPTAELAEITFDLAELKRRRRDLGEAKNLHESAHIMRTETMGRHHPDVGRSLRGIADCLSAEHAYQEADSLLDRSRLIFEQHPDLAYPDLALTVRSQAIAAFWRERYEDADRLFSLELAIVRRALGRDDPETIPRLINIARVCKAAGDCSRISTYCARFYRKVERCYEEALGTATRVHGAGAPDVANAHYRLGDLWVTLNEYSKAETEFREALKIRTAAPSRDVAKIAECLDKLAHVCLLQGSYREGDSLAAAAVALMDESQAQDDRTTAGFCYTRAKILYAQNRLFEAAPLYERVLAVFGKSTQPVDMASAARCLDKMAAVAKERAEYAEAEGLCRRAIEIASDPEMPDHAEILANCQNTLGIVYQEMCRYDEAETCYVRARRTYEDAGKDRTAEYATILNSLGALYADRGWFDKAKQCCECALTERKALLGENHPDVAVTLQNLGYICRRLNEYRKAEDYYKDAKKIWKHEFSDNHPIVAEILDGLGITLMEQGRYKDAEDQLSKALDITERSLGPDHPKLARVLESYSRCRRLEGDIGNATAMARRAFDIRINNFRDNGSFLPEMRALAFALEMRMSAANYFSCCMGADSLDIASTHGFSEVVVANKGQVSDIAFELQRWARVESDSVSESICNDLRITRYRLSNLFVAGPPDKNISEYTYTVDSLQTAAIDLETRLADRSAEFRMLQDYTKVGLDSVISNLPDQTVLVEYLKFDFVDARTGAMAPRYLAVILTNDGDLSVANLGQASGIDSLVGLYRGHLRDLSSGGGMPSEHDLARYMAITTQLSHAVLEPVEKHLTGCKLLLIAPDAALNLVSFGGLPCDDDEYLIMKVPIHYLSAARDVVRLKSKVTCGKGLLALGDPAYEAPAEVRQARRWAGRAPVALVESTTGILAGSNTRLRYSRDEVNSVVETWARDASEPSLKLLDLDATEENFKMLGPGKRVIHIATHGYFRNPRDSVGSGEHVFDADRKLIGENPLLLSGLLLAGGLLHEDALDSLSCDDGRLTAYEVSAMDLTGTDLVVLSACETALGEVREGEGVYGLRRAFQIAGARTVVSTLWQVPDKTARRMMERLYAGPGRNLPERIQRIQMDEIERLHRYDLADHPFNWATFVATGDWR